MIENKDTFLEHRKNQEKSHFDNIDISDPLSSLLTVEINTTELCNRTCVFCPRHDRSVYPNRNLNMSLKTAEEIANNLLIDNYKGKISYSGFSENLLNKNFAGIIKIFKDTKFSTENLLAIIEKLDLQKKSGPEPYCIIYFIYIKATLF